MPEYLYVGRTLGPYRLIQGVGRGGMAEVYLAEDGRLQRQVAVKVMPTALAAEATFRARFEREARAAARLQHPHILAVYDFGEQDNIPYLVMPFMNQGSLAQVIAQTRGPLPMAKLVQWTAEIGSALTYAHEQGIIHRDVKPGNMLLGPQEHLLLSDFGIAKVLNEATTLTNTGTSVGSPEYMAPEQATGKTSYRSDIYALGVVIFQMLTGRVPFSASTPVQVMMQHVKEPPPSLRALNPAVSPQVEFVVLRALAKQPEQRYQSATELAEALKDAATGRPIHQNVSIPTNDLSTRPAPPHVVPPGTPPRGINPAGLATFYQVPINAPAAYAPQQQAPWPAPQAAYNLPPSAPAPRKGKRGTRVLLVLLILLLLIAVGLGGAIAYVLTHPGFMPTFG
jgi:eukaryotic-like serine/threonine-protein kinase